jgi:hypothetical protein
MGAHGVDRYLCCVIGSIWSLEHPCHPYSRRYLCFDLKLPTKRASIVILQRVEAEIENNETILQSAVIGRFEGKPLTESPPIVSPP